MKKFLLIIIGFTLIYSCKNESLNNNNAESNSDKIEELSKADSIILSSIDAYGYSKSDSLNFQFEFRNKRYQIKNQNDKFEYTVSFSEKEDTVDILSNNGFKRLIKGQEIILSEKEEKQFSGALNSVIYFSTLPNKLNDKAVIKTYKGEISIKNKNYNVIQVTFSENGGGEDFEDIFYYWINQENKMIDFLAYKYTVNNGGIRFREAINRRPIGGIIFQDYLNYAAEPDANLNELPKLWENEELKEVSRIENKNIQKL